MAAKKPDPKQLALAKIKDLTIGDVIKFFDSRATPRDKQVAELVDTSDELELDGAVISEGDDNGAFVLSWSWVSFDGTPLNKNCSECFEPLDEHGKCTNCAVGEEEA